VIIQERFWLSICR